MIRKLLFALLVFVIGTSWLLAERIELKFDEENLKKFHNRKFCEFKGSPKVMVMHGDEQSKNNDWRAVIYRIPFKMPVGKAFEFGGVIKAQDVKGQFWLAIRLVNKDGKSIKYERIVVKKDQDWTRHEKRFVADSKTERMEFYILAKSLANKSTIEVKDLFIESVN